LLLRKFANPFALRNEKSINPAHNSFNTLFIGKFKPQSGHKKGEPTNVTKKVENCDHSTKKRAESEKPHE
jgi:hypothetical protein